MSETVSKSPDSDKTTGGDAPTHARGGLDATLPLAPGMTPGNPQTAGAGSPKYLGPYDLIEMLGRGGMGTVWKARHTKLDKLVALKILPPHLMTDPDAVNRFEREMKAFGKLEHAHIVRAMDAGQADGIHYLVMEYIEGVDLARLVKNRGPRSVAEACQMIRHTALGLAHAHEHGLVHRDIKPSNLLLSKKGFVKVLDLGLARLQSEKAAGEASLTVNGEVMGTPDYMAPEQWQSAHTVGPAVDLYALGCTLYFLLTGRAPFAAEDQTTTAQKMTAHLMQPPPNLRQARPEVPEEVEALCQRLLAKDPATRPTSAKDTADELRAMLRSWTKSPAPAETIPWVPVVSSTTGDNGPRDKFSATGHWYAMVIGGAVLVLAVCLLVGWTTWLRNAAMGRLATAASGKSNVPSADGISPSEASPKAPITSRLQPPLAIAPFDVDQARAFQEKWGRFLNVPVEYTNSLGMRFCLIPPGEYERGTPPERIEILLEFLRKWEEEKGIPRSWRVVNEQGIRSEAPRHHVRIAHPLYLAACEVTQRQFEQIMKQNRSYFGPNGAGHDQVGDRTRPDLPVENITFEEAVDFCHRLGERESPSLAEGSKAANRYRLPSDAEWEYACRAGTTTAHWFGLPNQDFADLARSNESTPQRAGKTKPNPFGLYDMHGNVWELCHDYFADDDFARFGSGMADSPTGPASGNDHVARGGSYSSPNVLCRSASRAPAVRPSQYFGFRPVLAVEAVQAEIGQRK